MNIITLSKNSRICVMIFDDSWTEGLTKKQQNCVVEYVLNECKIFQGIGGFKSTGGAKKFLESEKGRIATRKYCEFFLDTKKDTVKLQLIRIHLQRAFYNPAEIINSDGRFIIEDMKDLHKLGDLSFCIDGIETKIEGYNKNLETGEMTPIKTIKIKLADRNKSMDFLIKAFRLFDEDKAGEFIGEKPVFEMSDEERDNEIDRLLERLQKSRKLLPENRD